MKEQILTILQSAIEINTRLIADMHKLPAEFRGGAVHTYREDIPNRVNVILDLINSSRQEQLYQLITSTEEAVAIFSAENNLEEDLTQLQNDANVGGFNALSGKVLTATELLENAINALNISKEMLSSYLMMTYMPKF